MVHLYSIGSMTGHLEVLNGIMVSITHICVRHFKNSRPIDIFDSLGFPIGLVL